MTLIKPDLTSYASIMEVYQNYTTVTTQVTISGSLANGASDIFTPIFLVPQSQSRIDLYVRNLTTGIKRPLNGGPRAAPYTHASTETFTQSAYYTGTTVIVAFEIFNGTGSPITYVTQTLEVTAVMYLVPY